jgi:transcriptional regulator with XRE-family HTH domain
LQDELAERAGVAPVSIRRGESGQPLRLTTVRALAVALKVEPEQLMTQPPKD